MKDERIKNIANKNRIFVNRTLNMSSIKVIGFDMDYTIITYNVPVFESKTYDIIKQQMINKFHHPEIINEFKFANDFMIRGLVIDTQTGDFLKINRFGFVRIASHGTKFYTFEDLKEKYGGRPIDIQDNRYYISHTLFSQAEGCLYAQLVDYYDSIGKAVDYRLIFSQIRKSMTYAHQGTELKGDIVANPEKYIIRDKRIVDALIKFKRYGKKLMLITNSDYDYSSKVMEYCFSPFIKTQWYKLFDLVVVSSNKPDFFTGHNRYLKVNLETGYLSNFFGAIEWGNIYQGGNAETLESDLKLDPTEILYMGDHILGDVVTLKETIGWRTGLVVKEMADEVPILVKAKKIHKEIANKMKEKEQLEDIANDCREQIWIHNQKTTFKAKKELEEIKCKIIKLDDEIRDLIFASQEGFNKYWGEVMRAGNELSRFAFLVERYACIYMSGIANFYYYSPFKYYRSQRHLMSHDPQ